MAERVSPGGAFFSKTLCRGKIVHKMHEKSTTEIPMKKDWQLKRLKELLRRLKNGKDVARRDLENALTPAQFKEFNERWTNQKQLRTIVKPPEIKEYEALIRKAQLAEARYKKHTARFKPDRRISMRLANRADSCAHDAHLFVQEIQTTTALREWLDREDPTNTNDSNYAYEALPRVVTSRSSENQAKEFSERKTIRELKVIALKEAIDDILNPDKTEKPARAVDELERPLGNERRLTKDALKGFKF